MDDFGHACLTDFGLTVLSDATTTQINSGAGSVQWMAPEILNPTGFGLQQSVRTSASDIYAFGCVCLEVSSNHSVSMAAEPVTVGSSASALHGRSAIPQRIERGWPGDVTSHRGKTSQPTRREHHLRPDLDHYAEVLVPQLFRTPVRKRDSP